MQEFSGADLKFLSHARNNCLKSNAVFADYSLAKPVDPDILLSRVHVFLQFHGQKMRLEKMNAELRKANEKILKQQKAVIEEERLKVLLQMAGATAHELNQPLMALLGNIELMEMNDDIPEKLAKYTTRIKEAGVRISDTVKKIQTIRQYKIQTHDGETAIINIDQNVNILSVEDMDDDYKKIEDVFKGVQNVSLYRAIDIESAFVSLAQNSIHVIFLDHPLRDGTGFDFLIKLSKKGLDIPVVIITDQGDEMFASQMIQSGAYDYLTKKHLDKAALLRILDRTMEKARLKIEKKQAQAKIAEMSTKDELTGLFNRRYFNGVAEREISRAKRYRTDLALCMMDLDHFKKTNDTYGHPAGDMILRTIGGLLKEAFRTSDIVCRYGGEEFAVVLPDTPLDKAAVVCERFRATVNAHPFVYEGVRIAVAVSIGVAVFNPLKSHFSEGLVKIADQALYQAKRDGRNNVAVYPPTGEPDRSVRSKAATIRIPA